MKTSVECPWCKEEFSGTRSGRSNRDEHIEENDCGLVPRRDQEMAQRMRSER
jgi:hypothetical protein